MADNVQPDAGDEREATSGLLISTDPLQDSAGYRLSSTGGDTGGSDTPSADSEADDVDFDSDEDGGGDDDSDSDDSDSDNGGGGGALTVEVGGDTGDSDGGDSDDSDSDNSDSDR